MTSTSNDSPTETQSRTIEELQHELASLKTQLAAARLNLQPQSPPQVPTPPSETTQATNLHSLLLLSDSALPLGSFAFSSGLESYLLHTRTYPASPTTSLAQFHTFLNLSLSAHAALTLPFVLAAYKSPSLLLELDDALDAAIVCTVARRASVAQGRALLGVWERSLIGSVAVTELNSSTIEILEEMSLLLKRPNQNNGDLPAASAHLPPLFGTLSRLLGLSVEETSYVYLLSHVKAILSAAVRASIFGPYMAQKILGGEGVKDGIRRVTGENEGKAWKDAGSVVPVLDLWVGRHEVLYSRIFNS